MIATHNHTSSNPPRRSLRADLTVVGAGAVVSQTLGVITSLLLRFWLDPASMGIWQGLKLILGYSNYANLGASKGAARELSRALGRGEPQAASASAGQALAINTVASGLVATGLLIAGAALGFWGTGPRTTTWAWGLAITGLLVLVQRHVTYLVTLLRAAQQFKVAARITICEAVLTLAVAGGGVALWGLPGLYVSTAVVLLATWAIARRALPIEVRWTWDRRGAASLIQIGGPMLAAGALASLLRSLDKLAILALLSDREYQLGVYSLALMVTSQIHGLTNLLGGVLLPRLAAEYGRLGCERQVARQVVTATAALAPLVALGCAAALFLADPVLGTLLPAYRAGLAPLLALLPGCAAVALVVPVSQFQMAVGDERRALGIVAAVTLLTAALDVAALAWRPGLVSLAWATSAGYLALWGASVAGSLWRRLDAPDRSRYLLSILMTVALPLVGAAVAHSLLPSTDWLLRGVALVATMLAIVVGWCWLQPRREDGTLNWEAFAERCQKPDHRRIGNWLARRVARPAALRVTWLVLPLGVSAHAVTGLAWLTALAAAVALGFGTPAAWLLAAGLLQLWYLLDHVDGQLARWHGTASLDGVALDYLMHHAVVATTWFGAGWGLASARSEQAWILVGAAAALAWVLGALQNDVRYKAFFQRLKRVDGRLEVVNSSTTIVTRPSQSIVHRAARLVRQSGEMHVVTCLLGLIALVEVLAGDQSLRLAAAWVGTSAVCGIGLLVRDLVRNLRHGAAEQDFARWFVPPEGHELTFEESRYRVRPTGGEHVDAPYLPNSSIRTKSSLSER